MKVPPFITVHAPLKALTSCDGHFKSGGGSLHCVRTQIIQNAKAAAVNGGCPNGPAFLVGAGIGCAHYLMRKYNHPSEFASAHGGEGAVKQQGVKSGAGRVRNTSLTYNQCQNGVTR